MGQYEIYLGELISEIFDVCSSGTDEFYLNENCVLGITDVDDL